MSYQARVKTWVAGETLYAADLNAEFDAILATLIPDPSGATQGDILIRGATTWSRLAAGTTDYVLTSNGPGSNPSWQASASGFTDPLSTQGDIMYRGASATTRLAAGTTGQALTTGGGSANPAWAGMTTQGDIEYHNGTTRTRLPAGTDGQYLKSQGAGANPTWDTPSVENNKSRIRIPAVAFATRLDSGWATLTTTEGTYGDYEQLDFDAVNEIAYAPPFKMANWDTNDITVTLAFTSDSTSGNGQFRVSFLGRDISTPEAWDAAMTDHDLSAVAVPGTAGHMEIISEAVTASELSNNDIVKAKVTRIDTPGPTTLELLYLEIEYTEA